jgi:endonuclease/exonuclease/phosphatase family metal-dependent hydrolase
MSWNICNCKPSNEATWNVEENREKILKTILDTDSDVVCLQEASGVTEVLSSKYTLVDSCFSHAGGTEIWVKTSITASKLEIKRDSKQLLGEEEGEAVYLEFGPGVAAIIDNTAYISVHLPPSKRGADLRLQAFQDILESLPSNVKAFVIVGDTNMRIAENDAVEALGLVDAWKQMGSKKINENTWDSYVNLYHKEGYAFSCRFDRMYLRGLNCTSFRLMANTKTDGSYLSDHFGILADVMPP